MTPDPVLTRRLKIAAWARHTRTAGYIAYIIALALFIIGLATGLTSSALVTGATIGLIAGSVLLAPAIIVGYAVKAADRADRENDW